jgi:hypothetical protein
MERRRAYNGPVRRCVGTIRRDVFRRSPPPVGVSRLPLNQIGTQERMNFSFSHGIFVPEGCRGARATAVNFELAVGQPPHAEKAACGTEWPGSIYLS